MSSTAAYTPLHPFAGRRRAFFSPRILFPVTVAVIFVLGASLFVGTGVGVVDVGGWVGGVWTSQDGGRHRGDVLGRASKGALVEDGVEPADSIWSESCVGGPALS